MIATGPHSAPAPLVVNQRRHLVMLFTDLSDSTRIAATMEPELYADLLQQLRDLIGVIVPRHGGEIVRVDGDGALCIFGYPDPHEDAGRRATEAALDLHAAAASLSASYASADHPNYDVTADGNRFVVVTGRARPQRIIVAIDPFTRAALRR